jgi:hypothetical protein
LGSTSEHPEQGVLIPNFSQAHPSADFLPKMEHELLLFDPANRDEAMSAFHAVWARNLRKGILDLPFVEASSAGVDALLSDACEVEIR